MKMKYYAIVNGEHIEVFPKEVPVEETGVSYVVYTDRHGNTIPGVKNAKECVSGE